MIIIKYYINTKDCEVIFEGNNTSCINKYDELTKLYESKGIMMVNEIDIKGSYVREFATEENGHIMDLIMCGGIAVRPSLIKSRI